VDSVARPRFVVPGGVEDVHGEHRLVTGARRLAIAQLAIIVSDLPPRAPDLGVDRQCRASQAAKLNRIICYNVNALGPA
jgi:hypothetical protein